MPRPPRSESGKEARREPARGRRDDRQAAGRDIRVRMYRQGLGDCFLITIPGTERTFHMLVDCGVILGTRDPGPIMQQVAEDIETTTGGHLDVIVATHQHWDHLSGFVQAQDVFDRMHVGEVWLAWTEDPDHPLARRLQRDREMRRQGLTSVLEHLRAVGVSRSEVQGIEELLGFYGPLTGARSAGTGEALDYLREREDARTRYLRPGGEPIVPPGAPDVRIYVLGPPEDAKQIRKSSPTRSGREVYELTRTPTLEGNFLSLFLGKARKSRWTDIREKSFPFEEHLRLSRAQAQKQGFFRALYGFGSGGVQRWRRIDENWLALASELALTLDNDTNNTSLALAIELVVNGRVILMPADAQVGNWESWDAYTWRVKAPDGSFVQVTAGDLLQRTVLYKVGHHGSHNATLREKGLERMISPELVAMIPVDKDMARKKGWNMPFPPLLSRLNDRTHGRVFRVDEGLPELFSLSSAEARELEQRSTRRRLYVEYRIPM